MTDHPTATDMANLHERTAAYWREQAEALARALACVLDDSHSYESEGYAREAAREALARFNAAKGGVK